MSALQRRFGIVACLLALGIAAPGDSRADEPVEATPKSAKPAVLKPALIKPRIVLTPAQPAIKVEAQAAPAVAAAAVVEAVDEAVPKGLAEAPSTHKQSMIIKVNSGGKAVRLDDFCLDAKGNVLALVTPTGAAPGLLGTLLGGAGGEEVAATAEATSEVRTYDAAGKQAAAWPVGFAAQAINLAPGGTIIVGGNGKVARFDAAGKKLGEATSPQMEYIRKNSDEMREQAQEQLDSEKAMFEQQVKVYEEQLKILDSKKDDELDDQQKAQKKLFASQVKMMKVMGENAKKRTVEQALKQVTDRALKTHSICASDNEVFIVCPAMVGYGYGVWRTKADFSEPKEIIKSLSGCCGQMDVQCQKGELFVSENSRHRVVRYDRDGKEIGAFGKRDREGEGENFGGCCNPMNCCFTSTGDLYVAESNGAVKHFTPDGKYVGVGDCGRLARVLYRCAEERDHRAGEAVVRAMQAVVGRGVIGMPTRAWAWHPARLGMDSACSSSVFVRSSSCCSVK